MKRLELLADELDKIEGLKLLSFGLKEAVREYYKIEIEAIVNYGAKNEEVKL